VSDPTPHEGDRPRRQAPRWGEYATPEEVAEIRGPDADALPMPPDLRPHDAPPAPSGSPLPGPPPGGSIGPGAAPRTAEAPRWDAPITVGLLALGLVNLLNSIPGDLDFAAYLKAVFAASGFGTLDVPESARIAGIIALVIDILLLLAATVLSLARIRARRRAFWVPLAAGGISIVCLTVIYSIVLSGTDFIALVQNQR
jgi:hypothetical protein